LDVHYNLVSASNPVSGGSAVIQIFATGQGQTKPGGVDGLIEPLTLPLPAPLLSPGSDDRRRDGARRFNTPARRPAWWLARCK
jgi:hypothetical protein